MSEPNSPLSHSIGLSGLFRWFVAVAAVIAVGAAFAEGYYAMAIGGLVFIVVAVALGYRAWRARG